MSDQIPIEITEAQRMLLIDYISDIDITSWVEPGPQIGPDTYLITLDYSQLEEIIEYLQFPEYQADQKKTKKRLHELAAYLEEYQV